jgi:hypothetical protein
MDLVRIASTHTDTQDEQIPRSELESAAQQINAYYIRLGRDHDAHIPPLGRIIGAKVEPIGNSHFALDAELEVWDDSDQPTRIGCT